MKQLHAVLLITGIPLNIIQWVSIILWITTGIQWLFWGYILVAIPYAIFIIRFLSKRIVYICPQCHEIFKPHLKELFFQIIHDAQKTERVPVVDIMVFVLKPIERRKKIMNNVTEFLPFLVPLVISELALLAYTLYHILTHKSYKRGNRTLWLIVVIVGMQFIGPILYFLLGKEDS